MTVKMADLNANEKFFDLSTGLPTHPRTLQSGDLMLYGSRTLVLVYRTFATTYSYTRLGRWVDTLITDHHLALRLVQDA